VTQVQKTGRARRKSGNSRQFSVSSRQKEVFLPVTFI
jgi:hypothetical protein